MIAAGIGRFALAWLIQTAPPSGRLVSIAPHAWAWISADDHSANGALLVGNTGAVVVDPGLTPALARAFLTAVQATIRVPIRAVVLTHWHPDHALGISCLEPRPVEVLAHPTAARAIRDRGDRIAQFLGPGRADGAGLVSCRVRPPDRSIGVRTRLDLGGRTVEIVPIGPAHTDGDLAVWEPTERVLVTGDVFMHRASPDLGEANPLHWVRVLDSLVAAQPKAVVAGHFGPSTPSDLAQFRDYLSALDHQVTDLLAAGVPADSVPGRIELPAFRTFAQFPEFHATIQDNAAAFVRAHGPK